MVAAFLAVLAGIAVWYFASTLKGDEEAAVVKTKDAVVAIVNLPANTVITVDMVQIQKLPAEAVNALTLGTLEDVVGTVTRYPIMAAEQVMSNKISATGSDASKLAFVLKDGQRAISMSVDSVSGLAGNVYAGDYVDVIAMMMVPNAAGDGVEAASTFVLQKLMVLSTGMNSDAGQSGTRDYGIVTLAGTPDQILQLYYALNSAYSALDSRVYLVLRPATDEETLDTTYYRPKY
jgi:pilus assembly protein CpaB